ncbi:PAX-interacting protein 1-like [Mytilus galloprovincialis]|uniref:PAX-interacting protein 1-like n=1 Tax=Mytilus galloprovincialis TaxID=29158 RepID=UPI003F7C56CE
MTELEGSESRDKPVNVPEALFKDVKYYVVGDIEKEVLELLNAGGAKQDTYLSEMVSHVISDDPSQDEYSEAKELFDLPVVRSSWVYLSIKCKKQLPIPVFSPADLLFSGVVACSSQLDAEDTLHVWGMITYNGGKCQQKLDSKCTHLITTATEGAKYEAALKHAEKVNIVTPDWVTDSIKKEAKVDESIYHPRLIVYPEPEPPTPPTPPATPPQEKIPTPPLPQPMDTSEPQTMPILDRANMGLPRPNFADFSERVQKGRVRPDKSPRRSPGHQDSAGRNMSKQGVGVGSRSGHIPVPRMPSMPPYPLPPQLQQFQQGGAPQQFQQGAPPHLSQQGGAPHLSQQDFLSHMRTLRNITNNEMRQARPPPPTNKVSQMLGLNMQVPHRQPPPRYTPPSPQKMGTQQLQQSPYWGHEPSDNGTVVVIEQHGGQVDTSYSNRITHILAANQHSDVFHLALRDQRRVVTAYWLNDVLVKKKMMPPWQALHLPLIYGENKPCSNQKFLPQQKFRSAPAPGQDNNVENTEPPAKKKKQENEEISIQITNANGPRVLFTGFMKGLAKKLQAFTQGVGVGSRSGHIPVPRMPSMPPYPLPPQLQQFQQGGAPQQFQQGAPPHLSQQGGAPHLSQQDFLSHMRTLRNITNNEMRQARPPPPTNKVSQMLGLNMQVPHRQPPPRYTPPSPQKMGTQQLQQSPYWGHEPSDNVPADMCLLGCVFFITDYQKILGQEQIDNWKKVIEQHGGQVDTSYSNRITHILAANQHSDVFHLALRDQRRVVTAYWLNDVLVKKKMMPPWQALHLPLIYGENKPCSNQVLCMTNFEGEERIRIKQMINAIGARYTGHMTHGNTALICRKPEGEKYEKAKEWKLAVVNVHWLTDLVLGHLDALKLPVQPKYLQLYPDPFQMDVSLVHHLMVGWRSPLKIQRETWKKFLPQQKFRSAPAPGQDNNVENTEPPAKKKKQENEEISIQITNANGPRVLFTGFMKGLAKKLQANVIQLGGMVTENPKQCTHVVAPAISRTMKFFIAVNVCKYVVTKEWLEDSMAKNRFADPNMYALRDIKAETEMQCNLQDSISRAQAKPLFQDVTIYATPSIVPPISDLTKIVGTAGGTVVKRLPSIPLLQEKDDQGNPTHIVVTCEDDVPMLRNIIAKKITIHNAEFVLTGVMRQTLDFKAFVIDVH